jgi:hypothetical protein
MLKEILSVSGKPGLFKLVSGSNNKNIVIVESLLDKRKLPIYARDKVVSLGDIAMFTDDGEIPLNDVLLSIKAKENGGQASIDPKAVKPEELKKYFAEILPNYDRDRVYDSDIKKLINWYNLLISNGFSFDKPEGNNTEGNAAEAANEVQENVIADNSEQPAEEKPKKRASRAKKKASEE